MTTPASKPSAHAAPRPAAVQPSAPVRAPGAESRSPSIGADERLRMIREAAYRRHEQRGFAHGHDLEDWLEAEAQVDRMISGRRESIEAPESIQMPEPDLQQSCGRSIVRDEMMKRMLKHNPQRDIAKV